MRLKDSIKTVVFNNTSAEDTHHLLDLPAVWSHITQCPGLFLLSGAVLAGSEGGAGPIPKGKLHLLFSRIFLFLNKDATPLQGIIREYFGNKQTFSVVTMMWQRGTWARDVRHPDILQYVQKKMKNWLWLPNVPQDIHVNEKPIYNYLRLAPVSVLQINTT